jgi:7-alpha-hydroxysteroid dehydrogenase
VLPALTACCHVGTFVSPPAAATCAPVIDTTLVAVPDVSAYVARAAVPVMLRTGGGSVVMVSSAVGRVAGRGYLAYGTAKAAVDHSVRLMATDLSPRVRVNAVAPGAVLTEALAFVADDPVTRGAIEGATPLGRIGVPEDIAAAVVFLASDASSYMTGQILAVDGGLHVPNFAFPLPDL